MADNGDGSRKVPTIPSWQQAGSPPYTKAAQPQPDEEGKPAVSEADAFERGRELLQDDEIKDASHEKKVAYLEKRGLQADDIQKILAEPEAPSTIPKDEAADMQTVFDSNTTRSPEEITTPSRSPIQPPSIPSPPPQSSPTAATVTPKQDLPPIITYPEFLLKPQKPPPLVTLDRLANAGYILAGISALTWGASKYLVAPMRDSLTSARHDLQSSTLTSLTTLNTKLESSVSHVPYIPPLSHHNQKPTHHHNDGDTHSISSSDSDPTELFHRDIATQTSPPQATTSRRSSFSSVDGSNNTNKNATTTQTTRLQSLHTSLSSLLSSTTTTFSTTNLQTSVSDLQEIIDKIESNSQPLYSSYDWRSNNPSTGTTAWNSGIPGSTSTNTSSSSSAAKKNESSKREDQTEAGRFKAEIRALKGAFLSSRNFPSAPPPTTRSVVQQQAYGAR